MTVISKLEFEAAMAGRTCADVMHPWHPQCGPAARMIFASTAIGFNKFMLGLYLLDVLLKLTREKELTKEEIMFIIKSYLRTGVAALWIATTFLASNCIFRRWMPFNYYTTVSVPAFIGGLGISFESKQRIEFILYTWLNMLVETTFNHLEYLKIWRVNAVSGTALFMLANGLVMYEIRRLKLQGRTPTFYWFFSPPSVRNQQDIQNNNSSSTTNNNYNYNNNKGDSVKSPIGPFCPHEGPCIEEVRKSAIKFLGLGYVFGFLKTSVPRLGLIVKKPRLIISYLLNKKTISYGLFAGLYVALYKGLSCFLCQNQKADSAILALPCGTVAGLAFCVLPAPSILAAVLANLIFMYGKNSSFARSKLPMSQLSFALVNAILFHNYAFYNNLSPAFFTNMLNVATNDRCHQIYQNLVNLVAQLPKHTHPVLPTI
nr:PREDICTED: uncharacterized protein LOC109043910 [Bemisia tabaci]